MNVVTLVLLIACPLLALANVDSLIDDGVQDEQLTIIPPDKLIEYTNSFRMLMYYLIGILEC